MSSRVLLLTAIATAALVPGCRFTVKHDTSASPNDLPRPFQVASNATDVSAGISGSGFKWLDFTVVGLPAEVVDHVAAAVDPSEWEAVQKPGLGQWWGGYEPYSRSTEYHQVRAWTHPDGRVYSMSVSVSSNPLAEQPLQFHMSMFPANEAEEYLDGLNGIQTLVESLPPPTGN